MQQANRRAAVNGGDRGSSGSDLQSLGDPVRLQLMAMIASAPGGGDLRVRLKSAFELSSPTISHHLRVLPDAGLVNAERRGTWGYYRARREPLQRLAALLTVEAGPA